MKKRILMFSAMVVFLVIAMTFAASAAERTTIKVSDRSFYEDENHTYIVNVPLSETVAGLRDEIINSNGISFKDINGNALSDTDVLGNGAVVSLSVGGNVTDTMQVCILADIDGNAKVTSVDYISVKKAFAQSDFLTGVSKRAADINGDGSITSYDYLKIKTYFNGTSEIWPEPVSYAGKYMNLVIPDLGYDIYQCPPSVSYGYRYGASIIINDDNSYDLWWATIGAYGEADWISYKHSADASTKESWTQEKTVLQPSGYGLDSFSCCDPGVIYFNGYYYIGYTSTSDKSGGGNCNSVYVARSRNADGPFDEKWDGSGWSQNPVPIITYDGAVYLKNSTTDHLWGCGEPSFVLVDDVLYIYYTFRADNTSGGVYNRMFVATADATEENWPATIQKQTRGGVTISANADLTNDSLCVAYVEKYDKWIAVATMRQREANSSIGVWQSNDGVIFSKVNEKNTNVMKYCHNIGISTDKEGHIKEDHDTIICYAYGSWTQGTSGTWGHWNTRVQHVTIDITDKSDKTDNTCPNYDITPQTSSASSTDIIGLTCNSGYTFTNYGYTTQYPKYYKKSLSGGSFTLSMYKVNAANSKTSVSSGVTFSGYDTSIISISGMTVTPKKAGTTWVTASYQGHSCVIRIDIVNRSTAEINLDYPDVVKWEAPTKDYYIRKSINERKEVRGIATFTDGNHAELYNSAKCTKYPYTTYPKYKVTYSVANTAVATIDSYGIITPIKAGSTTVTATLGSMSFTVPVVVY